MTPRRAFLFHRSARSRTDYRKFLKRRQGKSPVASAVSKLRTPLHAETLITTPQEIRQIAWTTGVWHLHRTEGRSLFQRVSALRCSAEVLREAARPMYDDAIDALAPAQPKCKRQIRL